MRRYEYKILRDTEDINELGAQGWRVINIIYSERGEVTILEREIPPGVFGTSD